MKKLNLKSLPLQSLTFLVLPLLLMLSVMVSGGAILHQWALRRQATDHSVRTVEGAISGLANRFSQREMALSGLAERIAQGEPAQAVLGSSDTWLEPLFDGGAAFYSGQGELLAASSQVDGETYESLLDRFDTRRLSAVVPLIKEDSNATRFVIITSSRAAVPDEPEVIGLGIVSLDRLGLSEILLTTNANAGKTTFLVTGDGQIVYHNDPSQVGQYLDVSVPGGEPSRDAVQIGTERDWAHLTVMASFSPVPSDTWSLVQEEHWTETLNRSFRFSQAALLIMVPGFILATVVVWLGIRQIVHPLQKLESRAADLARGEFNSIVQPVGGIDEIKQLQATLRHMAERVQSAQVGMHHYIGMITQAQEDERARIARELHDQTIQSLVALSYDEHKLRRYLDESIPAADESLDRVIGTTTQVVDDLRRIIRAMRPIYLEQLGLTPALEMLAQDTRVGDRVEVIFEKQGTPRRVPPEHEMALYRITQEVLNNARRHSHADQINLSVQFKEESLLIVVRDNGSGFVIPKDISDWSKVGHFGIMGMHERAALIGAQIEVESVPGQGTTVKISIPLTGWEPPANLSDG